MVTLGIDAHKRTHTVVAVDERPPARRRRRRRRRRRAEHLELVRWAERFGAERMWAVEDCRHLSRRLEADLLAAGERIVRVPPKLMAHARDAARTYGKSDPIDALAVARAALRHPDLPVAQLDGPARELRLLVDHREDLVNERTRCINRLRWHLHELDPTLGPAGALADQLQDTSTQSPTGSPALDGMVARIAAELVVASAQLTVAERALEREITERVSGLAPALLAIVGVGPLERRQDRRRGRRRPPVQVQGRLRPPQRHRAAAGVVRQPRTTPALTHRQPATQRRDPPHRDHPDPLPPRRAQPTSTAAPRIGDTQHRSAPRPQAPTLRHRLPSPPRRRRTDRRDLPRTRPLDIGAKHGAEPVAQAVNGWLASGPLSIDELADRAVEAGLASEPRTR